MEVDFLYDPDCSSHESALTRLQDVLDAHGISTEIKLTAVRSQEEAVMLRFLGSPTIRLNGVDIEPGSELRNDFALTCRAYFKPDGRITPFPPVELIRDAVLRVQHGPTQTRANHRRQQRRISA